MLAMKFPFDDSNNALQVCFRSEKNMRHIWCFQDQFSKTALEAINRYFDKGGRTDATAEATYFIDFTNIFLVKKPLDLLYIFKHFTRKNEKIAFLKKFFECLLVDFDMFDALLKDSKTISIIGDQLDWIDLPLRIRAEKLINDKTKNLLNLEELIPQEIEIPNITREYILSWAYEEGKLNDHAIKYFQTHHPKKFEMLKKLVISHSNTLIGKCES